jgi:arylsulfatase A-like enzyme
MSDGAHPNIVFLYADQLQAFALGCMGSSMARTPNLDQLAADGVLFRNAYSNAPICSPFRAILFSGRYASRMPGALWNECLVPADRPTLAGELACGGYRTSYVGKWHLGGIGNLPVPVDYRAGFAEFIGYQAYNDYLRDVWFFDEENRRHAYSGHRTDMTTDVALGRLEALAGRDEPFALFVSWQSPHFPVQPAPEYEALFADAPVDRRPNAQDVDPFTETWDPPWPGPKETNPDFLRYGGDLDEYIRLYNAMVTQLDANLGRIFAALDGHGLTERTIVVFTSDHGDLQGSHGLEGKYEAYEEASRIPLIVRMPGGPHGVVRDGLVSAVDFFPTLLDWASCPIPAGLEGASFTPLVADGTTGNERTVFAEGHTWCMVRRGTWKLVTERRGAILEHTAPATPPGAPTHLFDLANDPYEMNNQLDDPSCATIRTELLALILDWWDRGVGSVAVEG